MSKNCPNFLTVDQQTIIGKPVAVKWILQSVLVVKSTLYYPPAVLLLKRWHFHKSKNKNKKRAPKLSKQMNSLEHQTDWCNLYNLPDVHSSGNIFSHLNVKQTSKSIVHYLPCRDPDSIQLIAAPSATCYSSLSKEPWTWSTYWFVSPIWTYLFCPWTVPHEIAPNSGYWSP